MSKDATVEDMGIFGADKADREKEFMECVKRTELLFLLNQGHRMEIISAHLLVAYSSKNWRMLGKAFNFTTVELDQIEKNDDVWKTFMDMYFNVQEAKNRRHELPSVKGFIDGLWIIKQEIIADEIDEWTKVHMLSQMPHTAYTKLVELMEPSKIWKELVPYLYPKINNPGQLDHFEQSFQNWEHGCTGELLQQWSCDINATLERLAAYLAELDHRDLANDVMKADDF